MFYKMYKMLFRIVILILMVVRPQSADNSHDSNNQQAAANQARLDQFFGKYCNETDKKILAKLEKCEEIQPEKYKKIESECVQKILKKSGNPSYSEIKRVECSTELRLKFEKCENEKMKNITMKEGERAKLEQIAKQIISCGFDCYGIKHE